MSRRAFRLLVLCAAPLAGCYQQIVDAVVDDDHPPGGMVQAEAGTTQLGPLPALASGDPLIITGQSETVLFAITCGDDDTGRTARAVLDSPGREIKLPITATSRSRLQFHFGGASCVAKDGVVDLTTGAELAISGTFDATGTIGTSDMPCTLHGSITAIPQYR